MIVQCPECSTKFNLPEKAVKKGGKLKCSVCSNVFALGGAPELEPEPVVEPEEEEVAAGGGGDDLGLDDDDFGLEDEAPKKKPAKDGDDGFSLDDDGGGLGFDLDDAPKKGKKKKAAKPKAKAKGEGGGKSKKGLFIGLAVLVLLLAGGGAYWFFFMGKAEEAPVAAEAGAEVAQDVIPTEKIKNIALQNIRQYYVNNDMVGKVFVIQGNVVNNFAAPKELIRIEATLFDANNVSVVSKQVHCGNTLSLAQLRRLDEQSLESELSNKVGILTNNTNVPPGGSVPFMVAFYNPPSTVAEFGVKVIEAKDPPK